MSTPKKVPGVENRRRQKHDGTVYWVFRVRYTDHTGRRRSEEFDMQRDAELFRAQIRLSRRAGRMADLDAGRETLADFIENEWWPNWAATNLERKTLKTYARIWNSHGNPRIGHLELRQVTPQTIVRLRAELERDGIGPSAIRTLLAGVLSGVFARALEWGRVSSNPVRAVKKPSGKRKRAVIPMIPDTVEAIRWELEDLRDRTLVSLLAYSGLRPEEALGMNWEQVRRQTLLVDRKNVDGEIIDGQKTKRPPRTIKLLPQLARDLAEYRLSCGRPGGGDLLFPRTDGKPWREADYRNWRRRRYKPAAAVGGAADPGRPYDLRHSYASMRIHEGRMSVAEIAEEMGHSIQMLLSTYSHVIAELKDLPKVEADAQITRARARVAKEAM
jgi:integrase